MSGAMEFATGALGTLLPKLGQLLEDDYNLRKNVRKNIAFLKKELEFTHAVLRDVGEVPPEQLKEVVRYWARDARELSYEMEDVIDSFLVHVDGPDTPSKRSAKRFIKKMKSWLTNISKRRQIGEQIKSIKERNKEVAARRDRYKVDIDTKNHGTSVDPRLQALYAKTTELVVIDESKKEIIMNLTKGDDLSPQLQKIVSIVGFGGLGKTTLAKAVFDEIKLQFDCTAFVAVSRNPDVTKFLKDMLYELDKETYENIHSTSLDVNHLIDLARGFIGNKRYFIVIDDIWDISIWGIIKCAIPDDNTGCKIITTTRKFTVAKYIGGAYEMKPLSSDNSKVLLYRRIFGIEDSKEYLNEKLTEVSDKILKKCAGVPLAIITIASLLATKGRSKAEWDEVYNSIGNGMENSLDTENMRMILSYSYYDLPSHLRTCLLYLSIFPEDFMIEKDRLIWLWIAEGFIQHKEQEKSLFELGESYFNELINRSMIQPMSVAGYDIEIDSCHVHDVVLDLIRSLSSKENFISVFNDIDQINTPTIVRRLSLQHGKVDHGSTKGTRSMSQVRSVVIFPSAVDQIPALQSFKVLRVLDLYGCNLSKGYNIMYMGNLYHLRYLSLRNTQIDQLSEEIGNLRLLETLDIRDNPISRLPLTVSQLKLLMCLLATEATEVPNVLGSLRFLEELSCLRIDEESRDNAEALGLLTELRVLNVVLFTNKWNAKLTESLCKLQKIQCLRIENYDANIHKVDGLDAWVAPRHLRILDTKCWCLFSKIPVWMNSNPSDLLLDLSILSIDVRKLGQDDILILGRLPSLRYLDVLSDLGTYGRLVVGPGSFPCLVHCKLFGSVAHLVFQQGAMPRLTLLESWFLVRLAKEVAESDGGFELGLGNLPSLQVAVVWFRSREASEEEVKEAQAAVTKEAEMHPKRPTLIMFP